jgi:hypothetical protein
VKKAATPSGGEKSAVGAEKKLTEGPAEKEENKQDKEGPCGLPAKCVIL